MCTRQLKMFPCTQAFHVFKLVFIYCTVSQSEVRGRAGPEQALWCQLHTKKTAGMFMGFPLGFFPETLPLV